MLMGWVGFREDAYMTIWQLEFTNILHAQHWPKSNISCNIGYLLAFPTMKWENQVTCDEQLHGQCKCKMPLKKECKKFSCGWYTSELVFPSHIHIKRHSTPFFILPSNYFCLWYKFPFMDSMQESLLTWVSLLCVSWLDLPFIKSYLWCKSSKANFIKLPVTGASWQKIT